MPSRLYSSLFYLCACGLIGGGTFLILQPHPDIDATNKPPTSPVVETAAVARASALARTTPPQGISAPIVASTTSRIATSSKPRIATTTAQKTSTAPKLPATPASLSKSSPFGAPTTTSAESQPRVMRIQNPYTTDPLSFETINATARRVLVNILCMPRGGGSLYPISGSGVIIDGRGVILTNAHVAQYVLLSESPDIDLKCTVRTGSPATAQWTAEVLYMSPLWVQNHASEINTAHPTGTGEHDYALLRITGSVSGIALPSSFPSLAFDTRDAIGFQGDQVLGASYPAEFLGGMAAENDLYAVSSVSSIDRLLTFASTTVDAISIGSVIEAQSGSSGGAVVNAWGRLIGIISTTSDAPTTSGRELRAITLSYIDRDMRQQLGFGLSGYLSGSLTDTQRSFNTNSKPGLLKAYIQKLSH